MALDFDGQCVSGDVSDAPVHPLQRRRNVLFVLKNSIQSSRHLLVKQTPLHLAALHRLFVLALQSCPELFSTMPFPSSAIHSQNTSWGNMVASGVGLTQAREGRDDDKV